MQFPFCRVRQSCRTSRRRVAFEPLEPRRLLDATVVFNELAYHPADGDPAGEWIELFNQMSVDMDLSGWRLSDAVEYAFPEGTIVPGGDYLVIAAQPSALESATGLAGVFGPFLGRLSNGGEQLELINNDGRVMNVLDYNDRGDWPVGPDGSGATLAKSDPNTASGPAENWTVSGQLGGTPGEINFTPGDSSWLSLIEPGDAATVLIPADDSLATAWTEYGFDDSQWLAGPTGIGYDAGEDPSAESPYANEVLADNPVGYWRFEDAAGSQVTDSAAGARHGTLSGGVTLGSEGVPGIGGNAGSFDGSTGFVQLPGTWSGTPAVTVEAWVNNAAPITGDFQAVVSSTSSSFVHFQLHDAGSTGVHTDVGARWVTPPPATPTGTWRHVVLVAESGNTRVYVNGVQSGAANTSPFSQVTSSSDVRIGNGYAGGRWFKGLIDEVAIYDTALSEDRIKAHYAAAASPPVELLAQWTFDQDATDAAGNHDGALQGGASITPDAVVGAGALDLRDVSGYVDVPSPVLDGVMSATVAYWISADSLTHGCCQAVFANDGWTTGTLHVNHETPTARTAFAIAGVAAWGRTDPIPPDGNWVHVAFTYDAATGTTVPYVNGVAQTPVTSTIGQPLGVGPATIGAWLPAGGVLERFVDGRIDDLRIYGDVLTADQIAVVMAGGDPNSDARFLPLIETDVETRMFDVAAGAYVRVPFTVENPSSIDRLTLRMKYDDGFVAYLNGIEVDRRNAPTPLAFNSTAVDARLDEQAVAFQTIDLSPSVGLLRTGENVLAIHGLNVAADDSDFLILPELSAREISGAATLAINEVAGTVEAEFDVELFNFGPAAVPLDGFVLAGSGDPAHRYTLPAQSLDAGQFLTLDEAQLGFRPSADDRLFLYTPGAAALVDAAVAKATRRGRSPDGTGSWLYPDVATPGSPNHFVLSEAAVINEIMYRPPGLPARQEQLRQETPVAIDGQWSYDDSGTDRGVAWREPDYDASGWPSGTALFFAGSTGPGYGATVLADGPAGFWRFDDSGSATAVDSSGNGRDGTYVSGAVPGAGGPLSIDGNAAAFDGATGYVQLPGTWGGVEAMTVEAWVNTAAPITGDFQAVVSATDSSGFGHFQLNNAGSTGPYTDAGGLWVTPPAATPTDVWRHIAFVAESGNTRVYVDGVQVGAANTASFNQVLPHGDVRIGNGYLGGRFFKGKLDEVAIYDRALGEEEIVEHYQVGAGIVNQSAATPVNAGPTTYYFRNTFAFSGDPADAELTIRPIVDDGAVYYLNGVEVYRQNLPAGTIGYDTRAIESVDANWFGDPVAIASDSLMDGQNVLAVEVHQADDAQDDVLFGIELDSTLTLAEATPFYEPDEEWIELFNRGEETLDLTGWALEGGIAFEFPAGTTLDAGSYLVVANDAAALKATYPTILVVGDFSGRLSNKSDAIVLVDAVGNPADEVRYFDGGSWSIYADGGGSSLELRDPDADNSKPQAWAASDEGAKAEWKTYTYRGVAQAGLGPANFNEFVLGLLDAGEVLLDDISVVEDPDGAARQFIQNGSFESDAVDGPAATWRIIGNHRQSRVILDPDNPGNRVLRLIAGGMPDHLSNHAETTLKDGAAYVAITNGTEYEISFRAKWLAGSRLLNSRLYFNRLPKTTVLDVPDLHGTPGTPNSRLIGNLGPTYEQLRHEPVVPEPFEDVAVRVTAADADGIASLVLWYTVDSGPWSSTPMAAGAEGLFQGTIPGQSASATVQFYVTGQDALGAESDFPAKGPGSRALYRVEDGQARLGALHNFRIIMTPDDADWLHANENLMSNDYLGATVVYDESQVFYDAGVRLKGSTYGRAYGQFVSYIVRFQPDNKFRGVHTSVAIDRSARGPVGSPAVDELLIKQVFNHAGGVASIYDDIIRVITPRAQYTSVAQLNMARYGSIYLDEQFDNGSDYPLHEFDGAYYLANTTDGNPESPKIVGAGAISYTDIRDLGDDKEAYRLNWIPKNHRDADDFEYVIQLNKAFSLAGTALDEAVETAIDVDQWMRHYAVLSLTGVSDTYTHGNPHNLRVYQRPDDGRIISLPHDMDTSFRRATNSPLWGNTGWNLVKIIERPQNKRLFLGHLQDLINTTYNTTYMAQWTDNYGSLSNRSFAGILSYIDSRADYVTSQLAAVIPNVAFEITTGGGAGFTVDGLSATLEGNGWINVREIRRAGSDAPLDVAWIDEDRWRLTVPVDPGVNNITLEAVDFQGNLVGEGGVPIGSDSITITSTATTAGVRDDLRIAEVNYNPHDDPAGVYNNDDFEFLELANTGTGELDLSGVALADGITFTFADGTMLPAGERILVVRNLAAFSARYDTSGMNIAGEYRDPLTDGNKLSNNGETIRLMDGVGAVIQQFAYNDNSLWPQAADGGGASLEIVGTGSDYNDPAAWHASAQIGGSPGRAADALVLERYLFYDGSSFDTGGEAGDDAAIATDKTPLLPGQTATFENYTNFGAGITGLMIDVAHASADASIGAADLAFAIGNDGAPNAWQTITATSVDVREGAGRSGSDRIVVTWSDGLVKNTWLQVSVLGGNDHQTTTGLIENDVFYFGNTVGEVTSALGDRLPDAAAVVNAADVIAIRDNPRGPANPAPIDSPYDVNRDRFVDAADLILARDYATSPLLDLRWITPSAASPAPLLSGNAEGRMFRPVSEGESMFSRDGSLTSTGTPSLAAFDRLMAVQTDQQPAVDTLLPSPMLGKLLRRLSSTVR